MSSSSVFASEANRRCYKCGRSPAEDPTTTLHRFPKPGKTNAIRCELWSKYCFPDREYWSPEFQKKLYSQHKMLCSRHFPRTSFMDYPIGATKLHRFASPDDGKEKTSASDDAAPGSEITQGEIESTSTVCEAPTPATPACTTTTPPTPAPATTTPAPQTTASPAIPAIPEHKPLPPAPPEELDPLAPDVKSEDEDSDTETPCTEELVYDETIEEDVTAVPLADDVNENANPVTPTAQDVLTTSNAVNIAPQTQAVTSQPQAPLTCLNVNGSKITLRRVDPKEIKNLNRPPLKLMTTKLPLSVLQRLKLNNQKEVVQVVQPAAQVQQSACTSSPTILPPYDLAQTRLLRELEICKKENLELRKQLFSQQKRNKLLEKRLANLKRIKTDKKVFDKLTAHMSAPAKALFEMQLQTKKKTRGRRYSLPGRIIALSIYKASPACYALLSKYFVLPSKKVLKNIMASARKQAAAQRTIAQGTDPNEPKNEENLDMALDDEYKMDCIEDLDLNDYNINNTFQQEIYETSEAVDNIVYDKQGVENEPQCSRADEDMNQMSDDTSEVQTVELCEGEALQLADGRIFQLIDGEVVEMVGELKQEELNVPCDETRGTGSSDELKPTVNNPQNTQECDQGAIKVKPLRCYGSARDKQELLSEKPQNNVSYTRQKLIDRYQLSNIDTSPHSITIKPNSFDGRPANVDELCISNPLRSQVEEQATQIKHPHRTQQQHTKHQQTTTKYQQTTKETSSYTDSSRTVTRPVISLKRVATDKEPITSPMSATQLNRIQQCYRKHFKTKETTSRGPDMPDLTFS